MIESQYKQVELARRREKRKKHQMEQTTSTKYNKVQVQYL